MTSESARRHGGGQFIVRNIDEGLLLNRAETHWRVAATGNMTLCVVMSADTRVLRVDMLKQDTMHVGLDGDRLARAYNDLALVAACPCALQG